MQPTGCPYPNPQQRTNEMTDKMSDVIYACTAIDEKCGAWHSNQNRFLDETIYIRKDSINVPDGLDEAIRRSEHVETVSTKSPIFMALLQAAKELQRIKGLK